MSNWNKLILSLLVCFVSCGSGENSSAQIADNVSLSPKVVRSVADISPPEGYSREELDSTGFGYYLRNFRISSNDTVYLHDGSVKYDQKSHWKVLNIDIGKRDLQQCADAVMRLRAEYLWQVNRKDEIEFHFTSGHAAGWQAYSKGFRPRISGSKVSFHKTAKADSSYSNFRKYLDLIFTYCGTYSLHKELLKVGSETEIKVGDVFIQTGRPYGHAVIVMDQVKNQSGEKAYLLAQSYMPAQSIHILINPEFDQANPWYFVSEDELLDTPHWTFSKNDLRRFQD